MKLDFVEICGFRGARSRMRLDLPSGFAVLSGRNGAGKSTVFDAVDFALTGTIGKFAVTSAKGGGLERHLWWVGESPAADHYVKVGFVADDGTRFDLTRHRERGADKDPVELMQRMFRPGWSGRASIATLLQTTLIRDELIAGMSLDLPQEARFTALRSAMGAIAGPDYSPRTGALLAACTRIKEDNEAQVQRVQAELSRTLTAVTEARSAVDQFVDVSEAMKLVEAAAPELPKTSAERLVELRRIVGQRKARLRTLEEARIRFERLLAEQSVLTTPASLEELQLARASVESASGEKSAADARLAEVLRLEAVEREADSVTAHLAALVEHGRALGLHDGHCPLCNALRTHDEFTQALSQTMDLLQARGSRLSEHASAVRDARSLAAAAAQRATEANYKLTALEEQRSRVSGELEVIRSEFASQGLAEAAATPRTARDFVLAEQERLATLERALLTLESSGAADRVGALESRVVALRAQLDPLAGKVAEAEVALERARQIDTASKSVANEILTEQFDTVMPLLKELYRRLRPHPDWTEIDSDFGGRVRGSLNFVVGDGHNPQFLFSSGQRRAAGLAFLVALHLSRPWCTWHSLLLDDPVQHIDDYRALNLAELLTAVRRTGEQVIVAVEDDALADVLCRRLRSVTGETGRRFALRASAEGGTELGEVLDFNPMPRDVLSLARAS